MSSLFSHVVGFDDFPFTHGRRRDVPVVGTVFSGPRLECVLRGAVLQDGANATDRLAGMVAGSKFSARVQVVLLQGIALGGFNVMDARNDLAPN